MQGLNAAHPTDAHQPTALPAGNARVRFFHGCLGEAPSAGMVAPGNGRVTVSRAEKCAKSAACGSGVGGGAERWPRATARECARGCLQIPPDPHPEPGVQVGKGSLTLGSSNARRSRSPSDVPSPGSRSIGSRKYKARQICRRPHCSATARVWRTTQQILHFPCRMPRTACWRRLAADARNQGA